MFRIRDDKIQISLLYVALCRNKNSTEFLLHRGVVTHEEHIVVGDPTLIKTMALLSSRDLPGILDHIERAVGELLRAQKKTGDDDEPVSNEPSAIPKISGAELSKKVGDRVVTLMNRLIADLRPQSADDKKGSRKKANLSNEATARLKRMHGKRSTVRLVPCLASGRLKVHKSPGRLGKKRSVKAKELASTWSGRSANVVEEGAESDDEDEIGEDTRLAPHFVRSLCYLRHLRMVEIRAELLRDLNYFRHVQRKLASDTSAWLDHWAEVEPNHPTWRKFDPRGLSFLHSAQEVHDRVLPHTRPGDDVTEKTTTTQVQFGENDGKPASNARSNKRKATPGENVLDHYYMSCPVMPSLHTNDGLEAPPREAASDPSTLPNWPETVEIWDGKPVVLAPIDTVDPPANTPQGIAGPDPTPYSLRKPVLHASALSDLKVLEEELVCVGSCLIAQQMTDADNSVCNAQNVANSNSNTKAKVIPAAHVDRQALLLDLFESELVFNKAKRELMQTLMLNYEHISSLPEQIGARQKITDLLAERPPFSPLHPVHLPANSPYIQSGTGMISTISGDYRSACAVATTVLRRRRQLQVTLWEAQILFERKHANLMSGPRRAAAEDAWAWMKDQEKRTRKKCDRETAKRHSECMFDVDGVKRSSAIAQNFLSDTRRGTAMPVGAPGLNPLTAGSSNAKDDKFVRSDPVVDPQLDPRASLAHATEGYPWDPPENAPKGEYVDGEGESDAPKVPSLPEPLIHLAGRSFVTGQTRWRDQPHGNAAGMSGDSSQMYNESDASFPDPSGKSCKLLEFFPSSKNLLAIEPLIEASVAQLDEQVGPFSAGPLEKELLRAACYRAAWKLWCDVVSGKAEPTNKFEEEAARMKSQATSSTRLKTVSATSVQFSSDETANGDREERVCLDSFIDMAAGLDNLQCAPLADDPSWLSREIELILAQRAVRFHSVPRRTFSHSRNLFNSV